MKSKKIKINNKFNMFRWFILIPTICFVWWVVALICSFVESWFYTPELWNSYGVIFMIVDFFILPSVAMFFVAKIIAPKYKNIVGCIVIFLCMLWVLFLWYGLSQMAY